MPSFRAVVETSRKGQERKPQNPPEGRRCGPGAGALASWTLPVHVAFQERTHPGVKLGSQLSVGWTCSGHAAVSPVTRIPGSSSEASAVRTMVGWPLISSLQLRCPYQGPGTER